MLFWINFIVFGKSSLFFYLLFLFLCDKIKFKRKNAKEEKIYMQSLPIGLQTFKTIRNEDFIYIDEGKKIIVAVLIADNEKKQIVL